MLEFIVEERRQEDKERAKNKPNIWSQLGLIIIPFLTPSFWLLMTWLATWACKTLLFYSAITEDIKTEIILKTIVIIIAVSAIAMIYTAIKESEIWRRITDLMKKER